MTSPERFCGRVVFSWRGDFQAQKAAWLGGDGEVVAGAEGGGVVRQRGGVAGLPRHKVGAGLRDSRYAGGGGALGDTESEVAACRGECPRRGGGTVRHCAKAVFEEVLQTVEIGVESAWGQRSWFAKTFE